MRSAATVKVIRETPGGEIEVLLLRRNKALRFASGYWVFAGGKIETADYIADKGELEAARIAAVREAQEESNVQLDIDALRYYVQWTTPASEPIRFKTYFFHTIIPYDQSEVVVDGSEILEHRWLSPSAALQAAHQGEIIVLPPTYLSLFRLQHCKKYQDVIQEWNRHEPLDVLPVISMEGKDIHIMYEGDAGYAHANHMTDGPRHRLITNMKDASFKFEYAGCDDHFPLSGGYH